MSNTDNITKGMGVGPTETFTTGNGTVVGLGQFGSLTKSNGMTDGTSVATASKNMAEIYNRILLDMAQCLDLACIIGDPANAPHSISDLLPPAQVEARDIEQNWTPISTLAQAIIQGIYSVRLTADNALETANQAVTDGGKFSFTGSIQYENLTNTITADGIGDGCEVGDVIRVTGTVQNNKLFTIESRVSSDKVIVNAAHAHDKGPLSLKDETLTSKVELLTKWYNAPLGLGQAWVNVTGQRNINSWVNNIANYVTYPTTCNGNRSMAIRVVVDSAGSDKSYICVIDGLVVYELSDDFTAGIGYTLINVGAKTYGVRADPSIVSKNRWYELR